MENIGSSPQFLTSPNGNYQEEIIQAIERAHAITLVTAFVTSSGIDKIAGALRRQLRVPQHQARLYVAVDRSGFNTIDAFRAVLDLCNEFPRQLTLHFVPHQSGFLHAKLLLSDRAGGTDLIIGSANLTRSALESNYEAGLVVRDADPALIQSCLRFINGISEHTIKTEDDLRSLLGCPRPPTRPQAPGPNLFLLLLEELSRRGIPLPRLPPVLDADSYLSAWIHRGYLVGRGRRGTEALVIRLPLDSLVRQGLLPAATDKVLGPALTETQALAYSVSLVPLPYAEAVRREVRRISSLTTRLALNLPCFGLWMPEQYWEVFSEARRRLTASPVLSSTRLCDEARTQRHYLEKGGGLDEVLDKLIKRLRQEAGLEDRYEPAVLAALRPIIVDAMAKRPPEMIAQALEFRTAQQLWYPHDQSDMPYRQLMVDVIQATFQSTYRTGNWPGHLRSHAARQVAASIAEKLGAADAKTALQVMETAAGWEHPGYPFVEAVEQFRQLVAEDVRFDPPSIEQLLGEMDSESEGGETDVH